MRRVRQRPAASTSNYSSARHASVLPSWIGILDLPLGILDPILQSAVSYLGLRSGYNLVVASRHLSEILGPALLRANVTDEDVLHVLRTWRVSATPVEVRNRERGAGEPITADNFGVVKLRDGRVDITANIEENRLMLMLLARWLRCNLPPELGDRAFPFTNISVNHGYQAPLHRDYSSHGPSVVLGVGDFTGGQLRQWPGTERIQNPHDLVEGDSRLIDIHARPAGLFNGKCWHRVEPFVGERFNVVFCTHQHYSQLGSAEKSAQLRDCGFEWPDDDSSDFLQGLLA